MDQMCKMITPYRCSVCGQDTMFFVTGRHTIIDYRMLFYKGITSYELKNYLRSRDVKYIKCISCNKIYVIDWTKGFPIALTNKEELKTFGV